MCDPAQLIALAERLEKAVAVEPDWQSWDGWVEDVQMVTLEAADELREMAGDKAGLVAETSG